MHTGTAHKRSRNRGFRREAAGPVVSSRRSILFDRRLPLAAQQSGINLLDRLQNHRIIEVPLVLGPQSARRVRARIDQGPYKLGPRARQGERVHMGRPPALSLDQRREALARREAGEALTDIARTSAVSHTTIGRLLSGLVGQFEIRGARIALAAGPHLVLCQAASMEPTRHARTARALPQSERQFMVSWSGAGERSRVRHPSTQRAFWRPFITY